MLRLMGADLVGMSTVPEIIVARHCDLKVLAISLVTNNATLEAGPPGNDAAIAQMTETELLKLMEDGKANHTEVLEEGRRAAVIMEACKKRYWSYLALMFAGSHITYTWVSRTVYQMNHFRALIACIDL